MSDKIPIIMCVDVEPDERILDRTSPSPWRGFEATFDFFSKLRPRLASATGAPVHFSWFFRMDPQVQETYGRADWPVKNYWSYVENFKQHGDAVGLHVHTYRWDIKRQTWVVDHADQAWADYCVQTSFSAYRDFFKARCEFFRFGDKWISDATLNLVERLGARFDLTLEPGLFAATSIMKTEISTGSLPDFIGVPKVPYRRSKTNFRVADPSNKDGLWMIPLSTGVAGGMSGYLQKCYHLIRYPGVDRQPVFTLNLMHRSFTFLRVVNHLLGSLDKPYLAFIIQTSMLLRRDYAENMRKNFEKILSHPCAKRFVFSRPDEAIDLIGMGIGLRERRSMEEKLPNSHRFSKMKWF